MVLPVVHGPIILILRGPGFTVIVIGLPSLGNGCIFLTDVLDNCVSDAVADVGGFFDVDTDDVVVFGFIEDIFVVFDAREYLLLLLLGECISIFSSTFESGIYFT